MSVFELSPLEQQLLHALQIAPRASWAQLATVLNASAVTLARAWARLCAQRLAWVSATPRRTQGEATAVVEVDSTDPIATAKSVIKDEEIFGGHIVSGGRDLLLTVRTSSMEELTTYVLGSLRFAPGVSRVRTHVVSGIVAPINSWRLRKLTPPQLTMMTDMGTYLQGSGTLEHELSEFDKSIIATLRGDGRASAAEVARSLDMPVRRVRPRLALLLHTGAIELRTDMSHMCSEWPISAWLMASVPSSEVEEASRTLAQIQEIRTVLVTAGPFNLVLAVWLRTTSDAMRLEAVIERKFPNVKFVDRSISLRPLKRVGVVVDAAGRRMSILAAMSEEN